MASNRGYYWPAIKQAININNDPSQPNSTSVAECPICRGAIEVTSFPPVSEYEEEEPGVVLLCGHVLCQACHIEFSLSLLGDRCPVCRTDLNCIECGIPSDVMPIPNTGSHSSVPAVISEGADHGGLCTMCKASNQFEKDIHRGEWPEGLADIEVGFVPLFYNIARWLERREGIATEEAMIEVFTRIINEEFRGMMAKRRRAILERICASEGQNPWFGDGPRAPVAETVSPQLGQQRRADTSQADNQPLVDPPVPVADNQPVTDNIGQIRSQRIRNRLFDLIDIINEERYLSGEGEDVNPVPAPYVDQLLENPRLFVPQ
ncbi:hypothetical protein FLONG3_2599 [Fusarium longipes]|uniref:RING-type domain-containing protein n=1 Tax=Fusarium longipes TaxID=694270 RepID=A0A395T3H8_9HYPO|nr:hypothetical protein FLONG3_2599 [Fusarium longipes]